MFSGGRLDRQTHVIVVYKKRPQSVKSIFFHHNEGTPCNVEYSASPRAMDLDRVSTALIAASRFHAVGSCSFS